jgi:orotate phosphoribosyltransferase-like protein
MEKQDRIQEMYDLVEQWQQSGLSQKQFSTEHNIKLPTFMYWIKKHRVQKQDIDGFARVELSHHSFQSTMARIEIALADGLVVRIF